MKWIPVSEQEEPIKDGLYLTTCQNFRGGIIVDTAEFRYEEWKISNSFKLLAWKPLPEPYRG